MKVMDKSGVFHDSFAVIFEITDAELGFIEEDPKRLCNLHVVEELMKSKGHNAHIVQLTIKDRVLINRYVEYLLTKYQSVSWIDRRMNKIFIKRNVGCLFN